MCVFCTLNALAARAAICPVQMWEKEQQINKDLNGLSSTGSWFVVEDKNTGEGENYKTDWNWKEKGCDDMLGNRRAT